MFAALWDGLDAAERDRLTAAGWTVAEVRVLLDLVAVLPATWGSGLQWVSLIADRFSDATPPDAVLPWVAVTVAAQRWTPDRHVRRSWSEQIGWTAGYAWAAGMDFGEARSFAGSARVPDVGPLVMLAGLRGVEVPRVGRAGRGRD